MLKSGSERPAPLTISLHGGWWQSEYDPEYAGHLVFWLARRHHVPAAVHYSLDSRSSLFGGVVALAAAADLRLTIDLSGWLTYAHDKREAYSLMGGPPAEFQDRYRAGNQGDLLPLGVKQVLIQGTGDGQIPPLLPNRWAEMVRRRCDDGDDSGNRSL